MKKILVLLIVSAVFLTGCTLPGKESSESELAKNIYKALPLPELYLEIPENYTVTSSEFCEEYYVRDDASIIVTEDTAGPFENLHDYTIAALVKYKELASELDVLHQDKIETGEATVEYLEFTYAIGEGEDAVSRSTMVGYCTDTQSMYIITCKCDVETYDQHREEFLQVLSSVAYVK